MSNLTIEQARDDVSGFFDAAWKAMTPPAGLTAPPLIVYDDVQQGTPTDGDVAWCRFTMRHGPATQATIGSVGNRRFDRTGVVTVQIFTPRGFGLVLGDRLGKIGQDIFEGKESPLGVWFRDVTFREIATPSNAAWYQTNVELSFEYEEIK